jgi:hypothetical protein
VLVLSEAVLVLVIEAFEGASATVRGASCQLAAAEPAGIQV